MAIQYMQQALDDLRMHRQRVEALENLRDRIAALTAQYESIKVQSADATPTQGGGCHAEEYFINNIVERERLKVNYKATKMLVNIVERGLAGLEAEQREILLRFADAKQDKQLIAERIAEERHLGRATIYRMRDEALREFTVRCYGVIEL